jgi:hypothetical protein
MRVAYIDVITGFVVVQQTTFVKRFFMCWTAFALIGEVATNCVLDTRSLNESVGLIITTTCE